MKIIPLPQSFKEADGTIKIPEIISFNTMPTPLSALNTLCERLNIIGYKTAYSACPFLELYADNLQFNKKGAYKIEILKDKIKLFYSDEQGAHSACTTLFLHIFNSKQAGKIQCGIIEDFPKYQYRGILLDTARNFFSLEELLKIIEQLSLLKYNYFHWHFADDQAWRIESEKYNKLTEKCGEKYYTKAQVRQIVSFAKSRGIEIIPEFEIPGHSSAAIQAYAELSCKGKQITAPDKGGIYNTILCAGKAEVYTFIEDIIKELCGLFPGEFIHLGGDEAPKTEWKACKHCADKLQKLGLVGFEQLQAHMLSFAAEIAKKHGKKSICWNDCLKADNLNENMIIQYWTQTTLKNYAASASAHKFIFSNLFPLYFDYPHSVNGLKSVYRFKPRLRFNKKLNGYDILGAEGAVWCEKIDNEARLEYMLFPRCVALSEAVWGTNESYTAFLQRLKIHYGLLEFFKISPAPVKKAQLNAIKSIAENIKFFTLLLIEMIRH